MKIVTITNQKGGTGKTTTTAALLSGLLFKGYKVLAIDLDAQCNLTYTVKANAEKVTVLDLLTGEVNIKAAIQHTDSGDIIAADKALAGADAFITNTGKEYRLKEALETVKKDYDYVFIDTPPALGILTVNALTASDSVIIPAQADIYSLQGIEQLIETIRPIKKYCNPNISIEGILLTRYNARSVLSREVAELAEQLADKIGTKVFKTKIREAIVVKESQISQQPLEQYAPTSNVTYDYNDFIKEFLGGVDSV